MKRLIFTTGLLTLLLLPLPASSAETVWKWVDENGVTQYTDRASVPEGVASEAVEVPEGTVVQDAKSTTERLQRKADILEQERKQRAAEAEEAERSQALDEALEREEILAEPEKKKKKKKRRKDRPPPRPTPTPPKPKPPSINQ